MKKRESGPIKFYEDDDLQIIMEEIKKEYGENNYELINNPVRRSVWQFWKKKYEVAFQLTHTILNEYEGNRDKILSLLDNDINTQLQPTVSSLENKKNQVPIKEEEKEDPIYNELYSSLIQNEILEELAKKLIQEVKQEVGNKKLSFREVREILLQKISNKIQVTGDLEKKIKILALIGPTGVGKTTTLAKIGGILRPRGQMLGFITTDVFRMEAVSQLREYAKIMKSSMKPVQSPDELMGAVNYFHRAEVVDKILIDTVGRSPLESETIQEVKDYLGAANPDHICLVLSATQKYSDLERILDNFSSVHIDSVIFTKLDETLTYGNILNVAYQKNVKLSYLTDGQGVPKCIRLATPEYIAEKLMSEVEKIGSSSASS